jgi:hypothetical protein
MRRPTCVSSVSGAPLAKEALPEGAGECTQHGQAPRAPHPAASGVRWPAKPGFARLKAAAQRR